MEPHEQARGILQYAIVDKVGYLKDIALDLKRVRRAASGDRSTGIFRRIRQLT
jgi:hypothetical protein